MSHSQFHSIKQFILRHAWLNLWDKHMTTGRINQVSIVLNYCPWPLLGVVVLDSIRMPTCHPTPQSPVIIAYRKTKGFTGKQCCFLSFNNPQHHVRYGFMTGRRLKKSPRPRPRLFLIPATRHFYPYYSTSVSFPYNKTTTTLSSEWGACSVERSVEAWNQSRYCPMTGRT